MHVYQQTTAEPGAKTEVVWLGSGQQINQVDVSDTLILSSSVKVVESTRNLNVIIDSFCRAMRCISAAYVGMRCPSVCLSACLSVCHVRGLCQNE